MNDWLPFIEHYWVVGVVIAFGVAALALAIEDHFKQKTVYVDPAIPPAPNERLVPRYDPDPEPPQVVCAESIEAIHEKYAEMSGTDPKRAGRLKYGEMLKLHGK